MALTRSTAEDRARRRFLPTGVLHAPQRGQEAILLLAVSMVVAIGLSLTYWAKTRPFDALEAQIERKQLLNLNEVTSSDELLPYLKVFSEPEARRFAARQIYDHILGADLEPVKRRALPNVGALGTIRITEDQMASAKGLEIFRREFKRLREQKKSTDQRALTIPLLTEGQLRQIKPSFVVRTPASYRQLFWLHLFILFAAFYIVHLVWWARRFPGDMMLLPMVHLLTGIGLMLMISLRDPLRDTASLVSFAQGTALGCLLMIPFSLYDYQQSKLRELSYVPLIASLLLSVILISWGTGPGTSDAKVNLNLGFLIQPMEFIKIFLLLFLAGYFAHHWEFLRELKEQGSSLVRIFPGLNLPRFQYALPVVVGTSLALLLFFLQKDLGPALVIACLFLALYGVARNRAAAVAFGLLIMVAGFWVSYRLGFPQTVGGRISLWLSPWDNSVRPGGNHLAHSFWAFATGGLSGTGLGLGNPALVPAAHTDLILSAIGEELGLVGLMTVLLIYGLLIHRAFLISRHASGDYAFFLGLGITLLTALQILLISGGILGLIPFSGVVSPFLSYGKTSMVANFILLGILASISAWPGGRDPNQPFRTPVQRLTWIIAGLFAAVLIRVVYLQGIQADNLLVKAALIMQADGVRRYDYNPRILEMARRIPRGTIYDRNHIPLATSHWEKLEQHREDYHRLGITVDQVSSRTDTRHYPLGALTFHLLGDLRTKVNWAASNTSFVERDYKARLQGYDDQAKVVEVKAVDSGPSTRIIKRDYHELIPLLRYRFRPSQEEVQRILTRNRDLHLAIDIRLQMRVAQILEDHIHRAGCQKGAAVVLDPRTGELLASVTYPWREADPRDSHPPETDQVVESRHEALLDRPRYGIYPPGSTFKLVTAIAALRKDSRTMNGTYVCRLLPDGRVGNTVRGWSQPIRDDPLDRIPHGAVSLEKGIIASCNAYFAQLGAYVVGAEGLLRTAELFGIKVASPNTPERLRRALPQAAYGQGQVIATPLQMARVVAAIANDGRLPSNRWVLEGGNPGRQAAKPILHPDEARRLAQFMRGVVTHGTGYRLAGAKIPIAGKTGTAQLQHRPSHAWFAGFAPYGNNAGRQIAFAIIIENGKYGGQTAALAAGEIVSAAADLGIIGDRGQGTKEGKMQNAK